MNTWLGLLVSYTFVFLILGITTFLLQRKWISAGVSRKIVHIGVSNWWILALLFFDHWTWAIIAPASFIILNTVSYIHHLFPSMEHTVRTRNLGTIYFPISLTGFVLLCYLNSIPMYLGTIAILVMGYGDGFAALFGEKWGHRKIKLIGDAKSYVGTLTMFVVSFLVILIVLLIFKGMDWNLGAILLVSCSGAAFAALIELITPWGLDNLTVPFLTMLFLRFVFSL